MSAKRKLEVGDCSGSACALYVTEELCEALDHVRNAHDAAVAQGEDELALGQLVLSLAKELGRWSIDGRGGTGVR